MTDTVYAGSIYTSSIYTGAMMQDASTSDDIAQLHEHDDTMLMGIAQIGTAEHQHAKLKHDKHQHDKHSSGSPCANCHHCLACITMMPVAMLFVSSFLPHPVLAAAESVVYHGPGINRLQRPPIPL
ncbi:MAG: hypothetical protein ACXW1P_03750 [Methylophilaceae bacterium]